MNIYVHPVDRIITNTCIIFGAIQGSIWACMSFVIIILHFTLDTDATIALSDNYGKLLRKHLYFFFVDDRDRVGGLIIQPAEFFIFMILTFILNLLWAFSSLYIYIETRRQEFIENLKHHKQFLFSWPVMATCVAALDAIFFAILCHDFKFAIDAYNGLLDSETNWRLSSLYSIICYGTMMTISIRGYVLWIINIVLIYYFTKMCITSYKDTKETQAQYIYGSTSGWSLGYQIPEESFNANVSEQRRNTTGNQSSGRAFKVYNNVKYYYDPEIEKKLKTYNIN